MSVILSEAKNLAHLEGILARRLKSAAPFQRSRVLQCAVPRVVYDITSKPPGTIEWE